LAWNKRLHSRQTPESGPFPSRWTNLRRGWGTTRTTIEAGWTQGNRENAVQAAKVEELACASNFTPDDSLREFVFSM
jgi:hypothetical protein